MSKRAVVEEWRRGMESNHQTKALHTFPCRVGSAPLGRNSYFLLTCNRKVTSCHLSPMFLICPDCPHARQGWDK